MPRALFLADLHCLSDVGLVDPNYTFNSHDLSRSYQLSLNKTQSVIYDEYQNMIEEVGQVQQTYLIGDIIEGANLHGSGVGVQNTAINEQQEMAFGLIDQVKCSNYAGVPGSGYHVGHNPKNEMEIIRKLSQKYHTKFTFGDDLTHETGGKIFHLRHVQPFRKNWAQRCNAALEEIKLVAHDPSFIKDSLHFMVRGHCHYWHPYIRYCGIEYISVPGWKGRDEFIKLKSTVKPDLGYVVVDIDNKGRYDIWERIFHV